MQSLCIEADLRMYDSKYDAWEQQDRMNRLTFSRPPRSIRAISRAIRMVSAA